MKLTDLFPGQSLPMSPLFTIDQNRINEFAHATGDHQWIHVDEKRCIAESPFRTTIAHGFLSLSLLPKAFEAMLSPDERVAATINYGLDKLRFLEPVRVNAAIHFSMMLKSREPKVTGELYRFEVVCHIKGNDKPAFVADSLMLVILA